MISNALERAIPESWDGEESWEWIAARWIEHMAATHGAHCAGPQCLATSDTPAYVGALRRMWAHCAKYGIKGGYRRAVADLAHELGVDLDG